MRLDIKPLSVNDAYNGRRTRSKAYNSFKRSVLLMLPAIKVPEGNLSISIKWGFSSKGSDIDNPCKPFIDCLQAKYGFNDNKIFRLNLEREQVKKGCEFIEWDIKQLHENKKNP